MYRLLLILNEIQLLCRSEIDHLTALLHSKTVDIHIGDKEKKDEVIPRELVVPHDQKENFPIAQAVGNSIEANLLSTPVISSRVRKAAHPL